MYRLLVSFLLALSLVACTSDNDVGDTSAVAPAAVTQTADASATEDETARLNAWFEQKYAERLRFSPIRLTFLGSKEMNDRLDEFSETAQQKQLIWFEEAIREMESTFDYAALSDEAKMSWDLLKLDYEQERDGQKFWPNQYLFNQMQGPQSFLPTFLINFHRVDDEADYLAYIARLKAVPRAFDQMLERASTSAENGMRAPRFAYEGVIDQSRKVIAGAPFDDGEDSALWTSLKSDADGLVASEVISTQRADELKAEARAALIEHVKPAYERLIAWAEQDSVHAPQNPSGVSSTQPNGAAYYAYKLRESTTTDMDADEIHNIGLREVERIHDEMRELKDSVGFDGDLQAFFRFVATDPQFKLPNTDAGRQEYIDRASAHIANIKKELPNWFGLLPKADLVVKRVEPFREQAGAAQHYFPSTPDGSRPGVYYAHLLDMDAMPIPELEVIAYHEGLPGHHMQIAIAQELEDIPTFRTQANFTVYAEGWGLYSEWLAKEMPGTYADPYSEYGRLTSELWRAVRLVVDTGMHAKGWTEQEAVDYFRANTSVPDAAIRSEVQRYLTWPGQATAYKIGMLKIQELRARAESELGDDFDIKAFHDTVLGGGALPLNLLERRVDQWIASAKSA